MAAALPATFKISVSNSCQLIVSHPFLCYCFSMWITNIRPGKDFEKLGLIVTRLARIVLYQKIARANTQLKATGIPQDLVFPLMDTIPVNSSQNKPKQLKTPEVQILTKGRSDF